MISTSSGLAASFTCIFTCIFIVDAKTLVSTLASCYDRSNCNRQEVLLDRKVRAATADDSKLWPGGIIPYKFDKKLQEKFRVLLINAINHWENHTCIDFVEKTRDDEDFVVFTTESCGCCSSVGRIGGKQTVSLRDECATQSVAIHELGHVIGFWHEHTRPDRDKYIKVHWDNIIKEKQVNFDKRMTIEINSRGRPYDPSSIMHYGARTFASGNHETMTAIDGSKLPSPSSVLSKEDILQTRLMYNCPEPECKHTIKGYKEGYISTPYHPHRYLKDTTCEWTFEVAEDEHIHLAFEEFELQDGYRCSSDYLEIRVNNASGDLIGYFCGTGLPPPITSAKQLYLKFSSDWIVEMTGFRAKYKIESMKHSEIMNLMLNSFGRDELDVVQTDNTGCVKIATSKHGKYSTLDMPNGSLEESIDCSFIIQADQKKLGEFRSIVVKIQSSKNRAYGPNCMGDVYTYTDNSDPYIHQFESSGDDAVLDDSRWSINNYFCYGPNMIIEFKLLSSAVFLNWRSKEHQALQVEYWIDYDECLGDENVCEQLCENTVDGFSCSCYSGYTSYNSTHCESKSLTLEDKCQQEMTEDTGIVRSSTEPYPFCSYNIILPDKKIVIHFIKIELPVSGDCKINYVEVRSGKRLLANICDNIDNLELDAGESMTITRYVDLSSVERLPYFRAEYYSFSKLQDRCVFDLYSFGEVQSLGFPHGYSPSSRCIWKLWADDGHLVRLNLMEVDLEETEDCQFDKLNIYDDRKRVPSSLIKTLCGRKNDLIVTSSGRQMVLEFLSDSQGDGKGFFGTFTSIAP